ncbi:protein-(glutamine-N5) methyltransferase, release factor-specific [Flexistipes sinusarabici DSM 4947]|uniref:peptide chain release factor N(5)-glutamine methyltransferase n=1 Tax=Flexistipes sinusarabici (strain ATCC 49648 / DSM 4947 / MAS 10) TaxID=717231 RepID=F8E4M5_FLESM|nr:peptide chain release factor N(5)-glutamine methyltransferase [Flexistipes sinusarabici]AEI15583.1 protein-(glutamine-N5) methyltransferase, release factor-specific [Flexistipes sinusarabici DSM 4947]
MISNSWKEKNISEIIYALCKYYNLSKSDAGDLVSYVTGIPYKKLALFSHTKFTPISDFDDFIRKLEKGIPPAYITNRREFYGREFYVDESVLIPRIETEILVDTVLKYVKKENGLILDLGTGSGCILLTLLNELKHFKGLGVDKSYHALNVAKKNALKYDPDERSFFVCADMLDSDMFHKTRFDIIICNPPYVSETDKYEKSILFEPREALFAPDNGLFFYKKLLSKLNKLCKKDAIVFYEIGNTHKKDLELIYKNEKVEFIKDLAGRDRIMMWKN